jgi:uracil-DNA glycosylase
MDDSSHRAQTLRAYADETASCTLCALAGGRTQVVFGDGDADAELMLVGEAPGYHEDVAGSPFQGQAGELLERLLAEVGLSRSTVYSVNLLKCRPPGNRDPLPDEIAACEPHLFRQIELVQPHVVATLGNFATRLLSGRDQGITRVHGREQAIVVAGRPLVLYPLYHPAAALYTPPMLRTLEEDFARIPALLGRPATAATALAGVAAPPDERPVPESGQLGLF